MLQADKPPDLFIAWPVVVNEVKGVYLLGAIEKLFQIEQPSRSIHKLGGQTTHPPRRCALKFSVYLINCLKFKMSANLCALKVKKLSFYLISCHINWRKPTVNRQNENASRIRATDTSVWYSYWTAERANAFCYRRRADNSASKRMSNRKTCSMVIRGAFTMIVIRSTSSIARKIF